MPISFLQKFFQLESASGIVLLLATAAALICANSSLVFIYQQFIDTFLVWINEGLMTVFFLVVGLELKRGFLEGQFTGSRAVLPAIAALGGMLIPACLYYAINSADPITLKGWATPVATDIAFAVGILSLFGRRVSSALKLFLLALAIFDDIGAILIITFFYAHSLSTIWLFSSLVLIFILALLNRFASITLLFYLLIGIGLWICLLHAGIHPTIAGVLLAVAMPASPAVDRLETVVHPFVAYLIMPLFAFANAGLSFAGLSLDTLTRPVVIGIAVGLFIGKQLGVFSFSWLFIRCRLAALPEKSSWLTLYGIALLCGMGFTMSLFLGNLSFENVYYLADVQLGVMMGSLLSGLSGAMVLYLSLPKKKVTH